MSLSLSLADPAGLRWAQAQVTRFHYLHTPVDARCSPVAYLVLLDGGQPVGCLLFGRPEATRVHGWYGSVQDVEAGHCPLTRWQVLNLARVWLSPCIQQGGAAFIPNAATQVLALAFRRVVIDYLLLKPPVWLEEPYEIRQVLSYSDSRRHQGTLYRAANFALVRTNAAGIQTYARAVRHLTHAEHAQIARRSRHDPRCQRLRALRHARRYDQLTLLPAIAGSSVHDKEAQSYAW